MLDEDRAAALDVLTGVAAQRTIPLSSLAPMMLTFSTQYNKTTSVSIASRVQYNSSFASTIVAGQPIQGNMRQLASDRWNYMYPSS